MMTHSEWLMVKQPRPAALLRAVCFPHAGAGGNVYRTWPAALPDWIEVAAVLLPGREARLDEQAESDLDVLLPRLLAGIAADLAERPFVLFGHSMGGLLAFELTRALEAGGGPIPRALVVTGCRAPHASRPRLDIGRLDSEEFRVLVASYGGTPPKVLANPELFELFSPVLRADMTLVEDYQLRPGPPLSIPIIAYSGKVDDEVTAAELAAWSQYTSAGFRSRIFAGGHFFLHDHPEAVSRLAGDLVAMGALPTPQRCSAGPKGPDGSARLRAASHAVGQFAARDAMPVAEFLKLLEVNLIGQDLQRIVGRSLIAQAAQSLHQPLPAIPHGYHSSPSPAGARRTGIGWTAADT